LEITNRNEVIHVGGKEKQIVKKQILAAAAAAVLTVTFSLGAAGCGASKSTGNAGNAASPASASSSSAEVSDYTQKPDKEVMLKVGLLGTSVKPVGVLVADAKGYFGEEGVKVDFQKVSSMNDAYMAVSTGDLDVYLFSSTAAATFIAQGTTTLRVFGGTVSEGSEIMAAKGSGITVKTADDLKGKTIACQMPETGQMVLKNYLLQHGYTIGSPDDNADVKFIYVNDSSTAIEGCTKGEYDLCITNASLGYYADKYGVDVVAAVKDFVNPYPCCRQTCNQTTYETNFDALVRFEIATLRGYEYYLNNEEDTLDAMVTYSGEDRDFLKAQLYGTDTYSPVMRVSLDPDKNACIDFYKALVNVGEISNGSDIDWDKYVVTDVYQTALSALEERQPDSALWQQLQEYFNEHDK